MRLIKSKLKRQLVVSFKGWDYFLPGRKKRMVSDKLAEFMEGQWKQAFDYHAKTRKGKVILTARKKKTEVPSKLPPATDMHVTRAGRQQPTFGQADVTPPAGTVDRDGVGWYGKGAEIEEGPGATFN